MSPTPPRRPGQPGPRAPRPIERSPGLEQEEILRPGAKPPVSSLKRLEEEEKEQARRRSTVHVGLRLSFMGVIVLGLFSAIIFRLWSLQVLNSSTALKSVTSLTTRPVTITPPRGLIEARNGTALVSDKVEPVVTLNRQVAHNHPAVVGRLAAALGIPLSQIRADISNQQNSIYAPVPIEVGVPPSDVVYLSEHHGLFPGVTVADVAERQYPYGDLAAQLLGYTGDISAAELKQLSKEGYSQGDVIGQSGVEYQYEKYLRGHPGVRDLSVDAQGVPVGTKHVTPATPGDEVVLNLDLGLQKAAQADLQSELNTLAAQGQGGSGSVVVEDPQNGQILAMASAPTYNPSWWVGGITERHYKELTSQASNEPLLNRVTQGLYTPGSTFKLATATAALRSGLISPYTLVSDPGYFNVPGCTGGGCHFVDDESSGCGSCDVETAITMSDDVFFYTMGYWFYSDCQSEHRYCDNPIQKAAAQYGLGQPSGIDLPGAYDGQVDGPGLRKLQHKEAPKAFPYTYYGPGDAINTAFGQGETQITPLELANAYATFANGGTRYAPEVAGEIISPTGKVVRKIKPKVMGHVYLSATDRQAIMTGLEGVTTATGPEGGTATATLQELHYPYSKLPIAGKTGTSQTSATSNRYNSLFVGFGPTSHPRYVIAAVFPNASYGADDAAPVVVKLFEYLIKHPVEPLHASVPQGAG